MFTPVWIRSPIFTYAHMSSACAFCSRSKAKGVWPNPNTVKEKKLFKENNPMPSDWAPTSRSGSAPFPLCSSRSRTPAGSRFVLPTFFLTSLTLNVQRSEVKHNWFLSRQWSRPRWSRKILLPFERKMLIQSTWCQTAAAAEKSLESVHLIRTIRTFSRQMCKKSPTLQSSSVSHFLCRFFFVFFCCGL